MKNKRLKNISYKLFVFNITVKCTIVLIQINSQTYLDIDIKAKIYRIFSLLHETVQNISYLNSKLLKLKVILINNV